MSNHPSSQEGELVESCLNHLRSLEGLRADYRQADVATNPGRVRLSGPWGTVTYRAVVRPRLSAGAVTMTISQSMARESESRLLVVADYLPEEIGVLLREQHIDFIDAAGNALLRQPPLYIEISGRRRRDRIPRAGRAFQPAGLKILYLLVRTPRAVRWTYREMAKASGVALGAIGPTLQELVELNFLNDLGDPNRRLCRLDDLLARWELGYQERLRPKLLRHNCRLADGMTVGHLVETLRKIPLGEKVLLGGEAGAQRLLAAEAPRTANLQVRGEAAELQPMPPGEPRTASLHIRGEALKIMVRLNLVPDPDGPVALLDQFGSGNLWSGGHPEGLALADPLLQHAELALQPDADQGLGPGLYRRFLVPSMRGTSADPPAEPHRPPDEGRSS